MNSQPTTLKELRSLRKLRKLGPMAALVACLAAASTTFAAADLPTDVTQLNVMHVPPASFHPGRSLQLDFRVTEPSQIAALQIAYRRIGDPAFTRIPIRLSDTGVHRATIPAGAIGEPGIEYHVEVTDVRGKTAAIFASDGTPHRVVVRGPDGSLSREIALAEINGLRSQLTLTADYVDYRTIGASEVNKPLGPRYFDAGITYRHHMLSRLEYIEVGVGRLRGNAPRKTFVQGPVNAAQVKSVDVGFDRGWAQLGLRLKPLFGVHAKLDLGADEQQFRLGGALGMRFGRPRGTRAELEVGGASGVGSYVAFRFDLATIPKVPVGVDIELTNWPDSGDETGERVRFRLGYEFTDNWSAQAVASYQALTGSEHGLGGGGRLVFRF